ncbi:Cation efflux transmembrane [Gracilaria domingensis]|nr:Cation efflux transmembrane [Gracilaria domingensis]
MVEALHTALDGLTVVISLVSVLISRRKADIRFSYGYARAEVLSALLSVIALGLLCVKLFATAIRRLWRILHGAQIVVDGKYVVIAEALTLCSNMAMASVLARGSSKQSLNLRALRAHVIADCIENLVVLIGGLFIWSFPGAAAVDPILTVVIVVLIVFMNVGICRETVAALMQAAPSGVVEGIAGTVVKLDGVAEVRQLHVWTLTSGFLVGSVVISADVEAGVKEVKRKVQKVFEEYGVQNVTVQVDEAYELEEENDVEIMAGEHSGANHGPNGYGRVSGDDEIV